MSLQDDVLQELENIASAVKTGFNWSASDAPFLEQNAQELVNLKGQYDQATDPEAKSEYQLSAKLVLSNVKVRLFTELNVTEQQIITSLESQFWSVLVPKLAGLLIGLL